MRAYHTRPNCDAPAEIKSRGDRGRPRAFCVASQNRVSWGAKQLDTIVDFTQGEDKIDLSLIDANVSLAGDQAFTFLEDPSHFTGDWAGKVWETTDARTGIATLNVSINSDPGAEMQIYMAHAYTFTAHDFIL